MIVVNHNACLAYAKDQEISVSKAKGYMKANKKILEYVVKHSGTPVKKITDFFSIWDPLHCEKIRGLQLPSWTNSVYPEQMRSVASYMFKVTACGTTKMNQLLSGPLLKDINSWIKKKINDSITEKMLVHSGHDFTLIGLLSAFGYKDNFVVDPASAIILELHKISNGYYIHMHYISPALPGKLVLLNIPKCPHPCSLSDYLTMTEEMEIKGDWNDACNSSN